MTRFTDAAGRTWTLRIDIAALRRVRARLGAEVTEALFGGDCGRILRGPDLLADALAAILEPQIKGAGLTAEKFADEFSADDIPAALEALMDARSDFFPSRWRAGPAAPAAENPNGPTSSASPTRSPAASAAIPPA
jgi:hypothetical protein